MIPLQMIYENDRFQLLSIKKIVGLQGQHIRYDMYIRAKEIDKVFYRPIEASLLAHLAKGKIRIIKTTSESDSRQFTLPKDRIDYSLWCQKNPNYSVERLESHEVNIDDLSVENFVKYAEIFFDEINVIELEVPSSFEGEENYIYECKKS
tara:strand:+ start:848 stop:1297 length:450 start_codon:yes stop_codon:yes gene_type:complete